MLICNTYAEEFAFNVRVYNLIAMHCNQLFKKIKGGKQEQNWRIKGGREGSQEREERKKGKREAIKGEEKEERGESGSDEQTDSGDCSS